jgi:uncharacterized delta-60 repeat protein
VLAIARLGAALAVAFGALHARAAFAGADGYFDAGWAAGGRIVFPGDGVHPNSQTILLSGVSQANGNLLFGGLLEPVGADVNWWLGELLPDGTLNQDFGINSGQPGFYKGRVNGCQIGLSCDLGSYGFRAFARQADGKVLVLSEAYYFARTNAAANALDTAGVSGGTGSVPIVFPINTGTGYVLATIVIAQSSGKVLVAGSGHYSNADPTPKFGLVRLNADLSVDKTFNSAGPGPDSWGVLLQADAADSGESLAAVLQQPDGHIVMVGSGTKSGTGYLDIIRLDASGTPDPQFGTNGIAELPTAVSINGAKLDRAGRILVIASPADADGVILARVTSAGQFDSTFGSSGFFSLSAGDLSCTLVAVGDIALDSAGRIVVGGYCDNQFLVVRIRGDNGTLDTSFGFQGVSHGIYDATSTDDSVNMVAFDLAGRLFVAGKSRIGIVYQAGVARLTYDLLYTNNFDPAPRGCLPPDCN